MRRQHTVAFIFLVAHFDFNVCIVDINECNVSNPCQQGCNNLQGSFECTCLPGFETFNSTHCSGKNSPLFCERNIVR